MKSTAWCLICDGSDQRTAAGEGLCSSCRGEAVTVYVRQRDASRRQEYNRSSGKRSAANASVPTGTASGTRSGRNDVNRNISIAFRRPPEPKPRPIDRLATEIPREVA